MLTLQSTPYAHAWCPETGGAAFSAFGGATVAALQQWRCLEGQLATLTLLKGLSQPGKHSYIKGALSLRNAWLVCRNAADAPMAGEAAGSYAHVVYFFNGIGSARRSRRR